MAKILQICAIDLSVDKLLKPLILASMEAGHEVHSACTDEGRFEMLRKQGLTLIEVKVDRKITPRGNLRTVWEMYKLMRRERYDIVHVHTPVAAILGRLAAKLAGVPHIVSTAHGFYFHEGMSKRTYSIFYNIEKWFSRLFTDWLLLQSREDYELCVADRFKRKERILHLSNGVDITTKFHPSKVSEEAKARLREELGLQDGDIVFSFIGRFTREKGVFELLEAFRRLRAERDDVKLVMIGGAGESERDDEATYAKMRELLDHEAILQPGFRSDIPDLLSVSDCFVLPSYREGLPRSIIEAMAMEKPILATNIRGSREEVFPGDNGLLVEKEDADGLYRALRDLAADEEMRQRFGRRSREIAEELFDEQKVLQKQLTLFDQLMKGKGGRR